MAVHAVYLNRSMPQAQIIPELTYPDVEAALEWLASAFGFSVRLRIGNHRAQLQLGTGAIIVKSGAAPDVTCPAHSIMVRVENVDEHYDRASTAGARTGGPPTTYPYGERQYTARDCAGYHWTFSQSVRDVDPSEWGGQMQSAQSAT
jgi:uncharacterized glyoxalase superfamily protein PhnB